MTEIKIKNCKNNGDIVHKVVSAISGNKKAVLDFNDADNFNYTNVIGNLVNNLKMFNKH